MKQLEEEFELESSAHVTFFTSIQCEAAFGFPSLSSAPEVKSNAVASQALWASDQQQQLPLMDDEISHGQQDSPLVAEGIDDDDRDSSSKAFAACLATPIEPPPEFQGQAEVRLVFQGSKSDILSNSLRLVGFAVHGDATKNRYSRNISVIQDTELQTFYMHVFKNRRSSSQSLTGMHQFVFAEISEEISKSSADRWSEWVRRLRRRRIAEQVQVTYLMYLCHRSSEPWICINIPGMHVHR